MSTLATDSPHSGASAALAASAATLQRLAFLETSDCVRAGRTVPADQGRPQNSDAGQDDRVAYGVSAMQGWRISMEDAHAAVLDLTPEHASTPPAEVPADEDRLSFFGVYDGHGGDKVAIFAGQNVHKIIVNQDAFKRKDYEQALKDGFLATDRAILSGALALAPCMGCCRTDRAL